MRDIMNRFTFDKKKFDVLEENEYTNKMLKENLPILLNFISEKDEAKFLGIYGRGLKYKDKQKKPCYIFQYILEYDRQIFPPHKSDYAPIFVYYKEDKENESNKIVVFDAFHYNASWKAWDEVKALKVYGSWHSFIPFDQNYYGKIMESLEKENSIDDLVIKNLSDSIIFEWWDREEEAKFVIQECLIDPIKIIFNENFRNSERKSYNEMITSIKQKDTTTFLTSIDEDIETKRLVEEAFWKEFEMKLLNEYTKNPFDEIQDTYTNKLKTTSFSSSSLDYSFEKSKFKTEFERSEYFSSKNKIVEWINSLKENVDEFNIFIRILRNKWPQIPKWIQQL